MQKIDEKFGDALTMVTAFVYKKRAQLESSEPSYVIERLKKAKEKIVKSEAKEAEAAAQGQPSPEASETETPKEEAQPEVASEAPAEEAKSE